MHIEFSGSGRPIFRTAEKLPALAYWRELDDPRSTLWVTRTADHLHRLVPIDDSGPQENPPAEILALQPQDLVLSPTDDPKLSIIVADDSESEQLEAMLTVPEKTIHMPIGLMGTGFVNSGRVDVVITPPLPTMPDEDIPDVFTGRLNRTVFKISWTDRFLAPQPLGFKRSDLLAHMLVDTALMASAQSLMQYEKIRMATQPLNPAAAAARWRHTIRRSRRVSEKLHGIYCDSDHPAADVVFPGEIIH